MTCKGHFKDKARYMKTIMKTQGRRCEVKCTQQHQELGNDESRVQTCLNAPMKLVEVSWQDYNKQSGPIEMHVHNSS